MIIKLENQPIISLDQADIVGKISGIIVDGFKAVSIYTINENMNFSIEIGGVKFGSDAAIIENCSFMRVLSSNSYKYLSSISDIYDSDGKLIGKLKAIELDSEMNIKKVFFINGEAQQHIDSFDILNIGNIVLIDSKWGNNKENIVELDTNKEYIPSMDNYSEDLLNADILPHLTVSEENLEVDSKYSYLVGKKLVEGLTIGGKDYGKNHIISSSLIKQALDSNVIVNLIMNAEE